MIITKQAMGTSTTILMVCMAAILGLSGCGPRPPQQVYLYADIDARARAELTKAIADYNAGNAEYVANLVDKDAKEIDLVLGPYRADGILWRSNSWRLWTRLETLATVEGELRRSLIRHLRGGTMNLADFTALMRDIHGLELVPIVVPDSPAGYKAGLQHYLEQLGTSDAQRYGQWLERGWIVEVPDLAAAIRRIIGGQAAFIIGSERMIDWLGRDIDNHPEGYMLPGSNIGTAGSSSATGRIASAAAGSGADWALGRGESFSRSDSLGRTPSRKPKAGALDLLAYLTSQDSAQRFARVLTGTFYYWTAAPAKDTLPTVNSPARFLHLEVSGP
jgi:hypothetical protein